MGNDGLKVLIDAALTWPKLISFNVGTYKSTADMGEEPGNLFDDLAIGDLQRINKKSTTLRYLNIKGSKLSREGEYKISRPPHLSIDFKYSPWPLMVVSVDQLRRIKHPKRVIHIDSIYRGKN